METKKLYRSCDNQIIAGIAGGLGEYFEIDPTLIRLLFLILIFSGVGLAAYIVAWILIPMNPKCGSAKSGSDEIQEKAETIAEEFRGKVKGGDSSTRIILGAIILGFGFLLLFQNFVGDYIWKIFWPAILILVGFYFITKSSNQE